MGATISTYDSQRRQLRQALILATIQNPNNKDVLSKITGLRKLIIEHQNICATAAREAAHKFDYSPTSLDAAYHELDRLFTIYESGRILKSAKFRKGPVACPLGHHAIPFEDIKQHPQQKPHPICGICDKKAVSGYYCSYCNYNLCKVCCVVYCSYGHVMTLWTHEESDHDCAVCKQHPIHSGYRCSICPHYDVCDYCTYRDGRREVAVQIFARMAENLKYMRDHVTESETADKNVRAMKKSVGVDGYPTILHLVQYSNQIAETKEVVRLECILSRVTKEAHRLRAILTTNPDICKTHQRVKQILIDFPFISSESGILKYSRTVSQLQVLADTHFLAKSAAVRGRTTVACPLGHAAFPYVRNPGVYISQGSENGVQNTSTILPPNCRICSMLADDGNNCSFCEYDLCRSCSVVYCSEGHAMVLWTIPEARGQRCYVCGRDELTSGYHCSQCFVNLCDMCTRKEKRLDVREKWEHELQEIIQFMHDNRKKSDIAKYLHWRNKSVIGSLAVLCDYVRQLRVWKMKAEKQIRFKGLIDKMKTLKTDIVQHVEWSATAAHEAEEHTGPDGWFFITKREAKRELRRLKGIVELDRLMKGVDPRHESGVACVLGHAMVPLLNAATLPQQPVIIVEEEPEGEEHWEDAMARSIKQELEHKKTLSKKFSSSSSRSIGSPLPAVPARLGSAASMSSLLQNTSPETPKSTPNCIKTPVSASSDQQFDEDIEPHLTWKVDSPCYRVKAQCRACLKDAFRCSGGKTCVQCEYDLCSNCLVMNCRRGHILQIWTSYDAMDMSCDMCCKANLLAGYRCKTCNIDICDKCTRRDIRESMKLWPKRDIKKLVSYFEGLGTDSSEARKLAIRGRTFLKAGGDPSMSELCHLLTELESSKGAVDAEIVTARNRLDALKYSQTAFDF